MPSPTITVVIQDPEEVAIRIEPRTAAARVLQKARADRVLQALSYRPGEGGYDVTTDGGDLAWCAGFYESPDAPNF
jgi:hypothetical protein